MDPDRGLIELVEVRRTFPDGTRALRGVSLTIGPRDYVSIVGPSGSGKSTLLNMIALLDRPTSGEVFLSGRSTIGLSERQRSAIRFRSVSFVFQAFHLVPHLSARENVQLGLHLAGDQGSISPEEALHRVGLSHRLDTAPGQMSGGERQRVAVARALARGSPLVVCDEPTGNLDSVTTAQVLDLLDELQAAGRAVIVVTHDQQVQDRAHRVIGIQDGELVTDQHGATVRGVAR